MIQSRRRGVTLIEVLVSSFITILCLSAAVGIFLLGMATWLRGQARIDANGTSEHAVRNMSNELREAMLLTVDGNGQGITYERPAKDASGNYTVPLTWDGVTRRFYLDANGNIQWSVNGINQKLLCTNVTTTDPVTNKPYVIFTPAAGTLFHSLTIEVANQKSSYEQEQASSRSRETVYLRNVPSLSE